ncbi:hypothetical protein [Streptomyces sp. NPDC005533]|uniref:hypothetical protein n=1 Tax=Streptomyces sp. NPDC005533 TaxID=3364723 RepID=UPI0036A414FA
MATLLPELHAALGAIGRPAAAAAPLLAEVPLSERRYGGDIVRDEARCRVVRTALAAVG